MWKFKTGRLIQNSRNKSIQYDISSEPISWHTTAAMPHLSSARHGMSIWTPTSWICRKGSWVSRFFRILPPVSVAVTSIKAAETPNICSFKCHSFTAVTLDPTLYRMAIRTTRIRRCRAIRTPPVFQATRECWAPKMSHGEVWEVRCCRE